MSAVSFASRLLALCVSVVWTGAGFAAALPQPSGEDHRAVRGRRPERYHRPHSRRQAFVKPETAVLRRGPRRRRRQYRHDPGRALRAGRLHDPGGELELHRQSEPLRPQSLRSVQGFCADHARGGLAECFVCPSLRPGQDGQGADRADEGRSRQIPHRQFGSRHNAHAGLRIVQADLQARRHHRAL